jgi:Putative transmembrane protein (Alph_Pro_TM)
VRRARPTRACVVALGLAAALGTGGRRCGAAETSLSLSPRTVTVGTFAASATLRLEGLVGRHATVLILVRGGDVPQAFTVKGRFGLIWATAGTVDVSRVPGVFLSFSLRPAEASLPRQTIDDLALDERALVTRMRIEPAAADSPAIREAYLRLKRDDGSYRSPAGGLEVRPVDGERAHFAADLAWPQTAPPGRYRAVAYEIREGAVVGTAAASFDVTRAGLAAALKGLADTHGGLYGVLAVVVTMTLGFGLDFVLARVRRHRAGRRRKRADALVRKDVAVH